ncbi:2Fe-2S iron-sulfur cluster-binding protein [Nocardia gamkensis]|uniref:2Fe-2S iron-sulfur cluster-binding protein n=1 Tax=Nocardia gamkensis TaxID=352869 RepID=UPI0036E5DE7D
MTVDKARATAEAPAPTGIPGDSASRPGAVVPLRVAQVIRETDDAVSLELDVVMERPSIAYRPGQFLTLRIPSELTGSVSRCYSLSSAPHEQGPLKVTVKRTPDGYASNWLCDNATAGMVLDALPPAGVFTPASLDDDLLLFAAGSGITPVLSILKSVLAARSGHCTLIYANRDERSVIFAAELADLSARHPGRLVVVHWLESVQGLPSRAQLAALAGPWSDREAFVCGPGPFMDAVSAALIGLGVGRERVHVEKFVSLNGNPFDSGTPEVLDSGDCATVAVDLDGETRELPWPRQQVLLDVLLADGLEAPYSCREGACSACTCRIVSGRVEMRHNEVLDEADLAEGYVLACQAVPITDTVQVTYS